MSVGRGVDFLDQIHDTIQANGFKIHIKYSSTGPCTIEWGADDKPNKFIIVKSYSWVFKVADLIKRKEPMRVIKAYASMEPGFPLAGEHNKALLDMWKASPCMHMGIPNKQAMRLLVGLRKHIPRGWVQMRSGYSAYPDGSLSKLSEAHLVERTPKGGFITNLRGLEVLRHWAETRGSFEPYLAAYLPKNWETEYKSRKVFDEMAGGSNEGSVGFRDVHR